MSREPDRVPRIAAVVLAAGTSSRMRGRNKLLAELNGRAVVRRAVDAALDSVADPVLVVVGHRDQEIRAVLPGSVEVVHNPDYAAGLATSLVAGIRTLQGRPEVEGAMILLGDMPFVTAADCDRVIGSFREDHAVVPVVDDRPGHPVLWARGFFEELLTLEGDRGARTVLERHPDRVIEIDGERRRLGTDIDTPAELRAARARTEDDGTGSEILPCRS